MIYHVYENYPNNRARVHMDSCTFCRPNDEHPYTGRSYGPYDNREDAFAKLKETGRSNADGCGFCNP